MDAVELKKALTAIGWKGSDLARKVGVGTSTVSRWMNGDVIPPWVDAYLGAMGELDRLHRAFVRPVKPAAAPPPAPAEKPPRGGREAALAKRLKAEPDLFEGKK